MLSVVLDRQVGVHFISVGTMWLSNKNFLVANNLCAALWGALETKKFRVLFGGMGVFFY